ncbi:UNVERIFIED_ORG: hypothetical protein BDU10_2504 [Burkholderia sp. CF145]
MKVWNMLHRLQEADLNPVVLYLAPYTDASDAEEIVDLFLVSDEWTCKRYRSADGSISDVHHPAERRFSVGWDKTTDDHWPERVIILSSAPGVASG